MVGGIKTALFGGEGLFFAVLRGPGKVWLQSLPFSRLASRIYAAAPQTGGAAARRARSSAGWGTCWAATAGTERIGTLYNVRFGVRSLGMPAWTPFCGSHLC